MPPVSASSTLRVTSDLWADRSMVFPAVALRIMDHHLHLSGIIPRRSLSLQDHHHHHHHHQQQQQQQETRRFYDHNWFCVTQSVTCFPVPMLVPRLISGSSQVIAHTWVLDQTLGKSSIPFASAITLNDNNNNINNNNEQKDTLLAIACRVFARREMTGGGPAIFTHEERHRWMDEYTLHEGDYYHHRMHYPFSDDMVPSVERLQLQPPLFATHPPPIASVRVGIQDMNVGDHVDHGFLSATAFDALQEPPVKLGKDISNLQKTTTTSSSSTSTSPSTTISTTTLPYTLQVQVMGQCQLNDILHCYRGENGRIHILTQDPNSEIHEPKLILIAEQR